MISVTGAAGHIGNVLVRKLVERGEQVRALLLPGEDRQPLADLPVEFVEGDILDYPALERFCQGARVVYHLAGLITILPGRDPFVEAVNITGTRNVIHAARAAGVQRLVYTSSIHAFSRPPQGEVIDEATPFVHDAAASSYDFSKAQAARAVLDAARDGLDAVIVCPTGVVGPYDYRMSEMGQVIRDCAEHKPQLYVEGAYDFVDVRDVADGIIAAAELGKSGEVYILSGEKITVKSLMDHVREITGRDFLRLKVPMSIAMWASRFAPHYYRLAHAKPRFTTYSLETLVSNSDISHTKAQQELGYTPRSLRESLRDTVGWFLQKKSLQGGRE